MSGEIYDVNDYTDENLYEILNLTNPTDRELEAKILQMIKKYENMNTESSDNLVDFFEKIYEAISSRVDGVSVISANIDYWQDYGIQKFCSLRNVRFLVISREYSVNEISDRWFYYLYIYTKSNILDI